MRNPLSRLSGWPALILAGMTVLFVACESAEAARSAPADPAVARGEAEALRDIREGHLVLRTFGFSSSALSPYQQLLEKRLGVVSQSVAGCVVTSSIISETSAYNDVMKAEIKKRFGSDIFERIAAEARDSESKRR